MKDTGFMTTFGISVVLSFNSFTVSLVGVSAVGVEKPLLAFDLEALTAAVMAGFEGALRLVLAMD